MPPGDHSRGRFEGLPTILIAAVSQGWALYALHMAITGKHWPATNSAWLLALYAVAALIPITVQMLAKSIGQRPLWAIVAAMAALFFYFGWHHGGRVVDMSDARHDFVEQWFPLGFVLVVLWLLMLPFVQVRIETGRWRAPYAALFANAWNNKLVLAEAALFTGLFWLLLMLWQQLFVMLGIPFFRELFEEPVFIYPVTSITFGIALHLVGSLERLAKIVLEQVLSVLKWLLIVAGIILTLFTIALATKLPGMIASGERAIGAAWLLWLVAVTVLLVNAAYRDGGVERPYPRLIANALRFVVPLTLVIALTALYALYLRVERYGFTVERVWACIVAAQAFIYSLGYAIAARDKPWMSSIARVNVMAAVFLMAVLALALTPVLSPYRIAANSQTKRVINDLSGATRNEFDNALVYLRFSTGVYGQRQLERLAQLEHRPNAASIRRQAHETLLRKHRWDRTPSASGVEEALSKIKTWPAGRTLDTSLMAAVKAELGKPLGATPIQPANNEALVGVFIDLDGQGGEEFILISQSQAVVFAKDAEAWRRATQLSIPRQPAAGEFDKALHANAVRTEDKRWKDLRVGPHVFRQATDN